MALYEAARGTSRATTHPGFLLADTVIPATGRTKAEIARLLSISRQQLYAILDEKAPVSPAVAVKLGKLFGNGPGLWIRMQAAYDVWQAEQNIDVSTIPTIAAA
jgi:addiction module HigA family antidote